MKKLLASLLVLILAAAAALPAFADSTPAIYKVTDGEGRFIYLMGTCHILTPDCLPIAGIDGLLDQCTAVALEMDVNEDLSGAMDAIMDLSGNTLSEETRGRIADFFDAKGLGMLNASIPQLSANALSLLVTIFMVMDPSAGELTSPELYLNELAQARGLTLIGLETADDQTQALTDGLMIYTDEEAEEIINSLLDAADTYAAYIRSLQEAWAAGDEAALLAVSRLDQYGGVKSDVTLDVIATDRNDVFYDGIVDLIGNGGGVFVAVGLLHVFDPANGLLVQLENAGYTVERWSPGEAAPAEEEALPAA